MTRATKRTGLDRWRVCLCLVVATTGWSLCAAAEEPLPPPFRVEDIQRLGVEPAVYDHILSLYADAQQHPREAEPLGKLGTALQAYGIYELAETCFQRAAVLSPGSFRWLYHLGIVQGWMGRYDAAIATMRRAAALEAGSGLARLRLAEYLRDTGRVDEAVTAFEALTREKPKLAIGHLGLGRAFSMLGEWSQAAQAYQSALGVFADYAAAHYGLGLAYRHLGQIEKAQLEMQEYERTKPLTQPSEDPFVAAITKIAQGSLTEFAEGSLYIRQGQMQKAAAAFERALESNPQLVLAHTNLIVIYAKLGQMKNAERHFREALAIAPGSIEAYMNWASVLVLQHKPAEAISALSKAVGLNPYYAEAHVQLGSLLEESGRRAEALEQYDLALQNDPTHRQAHYLLGRLLVQSGKLQEGITHLLATIAVDDEKTPVCLQTLAAAYRYAGQLEQARTYLERAYQKADERGMEQLAAQLKREVQSLPAHTQ